MGAAGQSGSGASEELTGGTGASVIDAGSATAVDAGGSTSGSTDAGTDDPDPPPVEQDAGEPHASFIGCRSPNDPGCTECKEQDGTSYNKASDGADWYNWSSVDGTCEPDCPLCASCSYATRKPPRRSASAKSASRAPTPVSTPAAIPRAAAATASTKAS